MPNYNDAQGVADLLSQFDFNIISEGPGDFSTQHRKYTCEFSKPGIESFTTTYQCNPRFGGQPTATDVFAALASDALAVDGRHIDDFADEMGFEKPSQAIRAYESCQKTLDWLKNDMQLMTSEISDIAETLSAKSPTPRLTSTPTTCSSGFPITTSGLRRRMPKAFSKVARATSSR